MKSFKKMKTKQVIVSNNQCNHEERSWDGAMKNWKQKINEK